MSNDPSSFSYFSFFFFIHLMLAFKIHSWSRLIRTCTTHTSSHTCKYHGREYMRIVHTHTDRLETHSRGTHVREHTLSQLTQKEGEHYEDRLRCWRACCRVPVLHCSWMLSWNKNNEGWISVCPALPVPTGTLRFFFFYASRQKGTKGDSFACFFYVTFFLFVFMFFCFYIYSCSLKFFLFSFYFRALNVIYIIFAINKDI